jgi:hypothetical protein
LAVRLLFQLAVLVALLALAPTASATHVQCGDVITESVKLDSDVICPHDFGGAALVIGADNIKLDLRGFSVVGPDNEELAAIESDTPHHNVTIRDGFIRSEFDQGTQIRVELSQSVLRNLNAAGIGGVTLIGDRNVVQANSIFASFSGLRIFGDDNRVFGNRVRAVEGYGIGATGRGIEIDRNTVTLSETYGFHDAIAVWDFEDIEIQRNVVTSFDSDGIEIGRGSGALIDRNIAAHNANGIRVDDLASEVVVSRNQTNDNASGYSESGTGIRVDSASTLITRNTANDNLDYGIWAVPGVLDGGGNSASGNGIADCVNVTCR